MADDEKRANTKKCILLAKQYYTDGDLEKAIRLLEKSQRILPTPEAESLLRKYQAAPPKRRAPPPPCRPTPPTPTPPTTPIPKLKVPSGSDENISDRTEYDDVADDEFEYDISHQAHPEQNSAPQQNSADISNISSEANSSENTTLPQSKSNTIDKPSQDSEDQPDQPVVDASPSVIEINRILSIPKSSKHYFYTVLDLSYEASSKEIKKKYRKISLLIHPDKNQNLIDIEKDNCQSAFNELQEAYNTLSDDEKRQNYLTDQEKTPEQQQATTPKRTPTEVKLYKRRDNILYTGEINDKGQAHGYGEMQFSAIVMLSENTNSVDESLIDTDVKCTRIVAANFVDDEISESNVRIDFVVPGCVKEEQFYKGEYLIKGNRIYRNGRGVMRWADGSEYDGLWLNDKFHDNRKEFSDSVFLNKSGGYKYIGGFEHGLRSGQGMLRFFRPKPASYCGGFSRDQYHGYGTFQDDEQSYQGQWNHGLKQGHGHQENLKDGSKIEGTWQDGQVHGKNIQMYHPKAGVFRGEFEMGKRGRGVITKV